MENHESHEFLRGGIPMTRLQARNILERAFDSLFNAASKRYGFPAKLQYGEWRGKLGLRPMEGRTQRFDGPSSRLEIARLDIAMPDGFPDKTVDVWPGCDEPVDAYEFVGMLVAMFHERDHLDQLTMPYVKGDPLCQVMAVDSLATQLNPCYEHENYNKSPMEIGAQYSALARTYQVLRCMDGVSLKEAEEYILYYQQRRQGNMSKDFVPRPKDGKYGSMDELSDAFRKAFVDGVHERWKYGVLNVSNLPDDAARRLGSNFAMMARFQAEPDSFEQEKMLAALYFEHMAERFKDGAELRDAALSAIREELGLDLSMDAAFGESALRRIVRTEAERNAVREATVTAFDELARRSGSKENGDMVKGVVDAIDGLER